MFTAALITMTKTGPRCRLTEEWIKKMWCIYTVEFYSAIKKNDLKVLDYLKKKKSLGIPEYQGKCLRSHLLLSSLLFKKI